MTVQTGVGGIICAAHRDEDGKLHGHTWEVVAWWPDGQDALVLQAKLQSILNLYDHEELGPRISRGENLAAAIGSALEGCVEVQLNRPAERIYARWTAA